MMTSTLELYLNASLSALDCIERAPNSAKKVEIKSILHLGYGYDRILRALRARWPRVDIVAADLITEAADYCAQTFNAVAFHSQKDLSSAAINKTFDLIWGGSVFTHLPANDWPKMLAYLSEHLAADGTLVFTTNGRATQWVFENHTLSKSHITSDQFETIKSNFTRSVFAFIDYTAGMIRHINDKTGAAVSEGHYGFCFSQPG